MFKLHIVVEILYRVFYITYVCLRVIYVCIFFFGGVHQHPSKESASRQLAITCALECVFKQSTIDQGMVLLCYLGAARCWNFQSECAQFSAGLRGCSVEEPFADPYQQGFV